MTDALELIAEAQRRQKAAERKAEYWESRANRERARCKAVIAAINRRPIDPPKLYDRHPYWEWTENVVSEFVRVIQDPHAAFDDGEGDMTHERASMIIAYRIEDAIKAAVERKDESQ